MTSIICPECKGLVSKNSNGYIEGHEARLIYEGGYEEIGTCPGSGTYHFEGQKPSSVRAIPTAPPGSGKKRK